MEEPRDAALSGTSARLLAAQYRSGANLAQRVGVYRYLHEDAPGPADFESWVLDHHRWTGIETVIDVGCGPGAYVAPLARRARHLVAVDLSLGMLAECRSGSPAGAAVVSAAANAELLPLPRGRAQVLLAAHMLYHVTDIAGALDEFRRVVEPGGTFISVLNGAHDKAEIRSVWQDAGAAVLGRPFEAPRWESRANLDNMPEMVAAHFGAVAVDRLPGEFRFPTPEPLVAWVESMRDGTEHLLSDAEWAAVLAETRRRAQAHIDRHGVFVATKLSGVIVAR